MSFWIPDRPRHDIYVRVQNVLGVDLRSVEVADGVVLDWQRTKSGEGPERLVGVEVLNARGVEVDGVQVDRRGVVETAAAALVEHLAIEDYDETDGKLKAWEDERDWLESSLADAVHLARSRRLAR